MVNNGVASEYEFETNKSNRVIVNTETGEIEKELTVGDRVVSKSQDEYTSTHVMNFNSDKPFVKLYTDIIPILRKYLTPGEFTFFISLSEFVSYEDGVVRRCGHGNCDVINQKELSELLDMPYSTVRQMMRKLTIKGLVASVKTGYIYPKEKERYTVMYVVNPYVIFKGVNANKKIIYEFFNNTGWKEVIDDWIRYREIDVQNN